MKQTEQERIDSGVSLEPSLPGGEDDNSDGVLEYLNTAIVGLTAGQTEPYLSDLLRTVEQGKCNPDQAGGACVILSNYYLDIYNNLNGNRDPERAAYYAKLAGDYSPGWKDPANYALATAYIFQGNAAGAAEALLLCIRAGNPQALSIASWSRAYDLLLPNGTEVTWHWGLLYLSLRRKSQAEESFSAFERSEAGSLATSLLHDEVVSNKAALTQNSNLLMVFKQQISLAMEAKPDGEDLRILEGLTEWHAEDRVERRLLPWVKPLMWLTIGVYILYVITTYFVGGHIFNGYKDLNGIAEVLAESVNCVVSSLVPLLLYAFLVRIICRSTRKSMFVKLFIRSALLFVATFLLSYLFQDGMDVGIVSGLLTFIYVGVSPFLMIYSAMERSVK